MKRSTVVVLGVLALGVRFALSALASGSSGGYLGVGLSDLPGAYAGKGAMVRVISPNSPAARAGLAVKDVVTSVDGNPVTSKSTVKNYVSTKGPNDTIELQIMRFNGFQWARQTINVTLAEPPTARPHARAAAAPAPEESEAPAPAAAAATGHRATASIGGITWVTFTDPQEQAFTVDVPRGWDTQGGLVRTGPLNISPFARALSPDKSTYMMLGDPQIPLYAELTPQMRQLGLREGQPYNPGHGQEMLMPYMPGVEYARYHGNRTLPKLCSNLQSTVSSDRSDLLASRTATQGAHLNAGEVSYTCTHAGTPARAYIRAITYEVPSQMAPMWGIDQLGGFIAPADQYDRAMAMLEHMLASVRENPQWTARQQQITQETRGQIASEHQHWTAQNQQWYSSTMTNMNAQFQNYKSRMAAENRQFQGMDEAITGTSTYLDSSTGQSYNLDNTKNYQWVEPNGQTVGTDTPGAPVPGSRGLQKQPPGGGD
jgi:hypothetical protein